MNWPYLLPVPASLLGWVRGAIVIARLMGLRDPRQVGSRNPGATNILRYGGKVAAVLTLLGDVLKGALALLAARTLTADPGIIALTGFAAFLGHLFPVYFGFRGGKGVATALGVWLAVNPWVGLLLAGTWLLVAALFRYSSLAALTAALAAPVSVWWLGAGTPYLVAGVAISAALIVRQRSNIRKLLAGKETRIGK